MLSVTETAACCFICIFYYTGVVSSVLQVRKLKLREVIWLAQGLIDVV